jgi:hypothetical protein
MMEMEQKSPSYCAAVLIVAPRGLFSLSTQGHLHPIVGRKLD